jgi:putative membrane protein
MDGANPADLAGIEGFLRYVMPTRGSLMLDVVFVAMFAVVPLLFLSIQLAKRGQFALHKLAQLVLGSVLLVAVIAFEVDMRVSGWQHRATASPYFKTASAGGLDWSCPVGISLAIHLCFAIPTAILWTYVIVMALRKFPSPPKPNEHSHAHKKFSWLGTIGMVGTAVTGWAFYYLAFMAG